MPDAVKKFVGIILFRIIIPMLLLFFVLIVTNLAYYFLPIIVLYIFAVYIRNRLRRKRIQRISESIGYISEAPDNLRPVEIGLLYDQTMTINEIVSILFYLVYKGVVRITVDRAKEGLTKGEYTMTLLDTDETTLKEYEKTFLKSLFCNGRSVSWSSFNEGQAVEKHLGEISFQVNQELQRLGYYYFGEDYVNQTYEEAFKKIGSHKFRAIHAAIKSLGLGFSPYITEKGTRLLPAILGYRQYLIVAEKERGDFHTDPKREGLFVDKHFPYTLALDVSSRWGSELIGTTAEFIWSKRSTKYMESTR